MKFVVLALLVVCALQAVHAGAGGVATGALRLPAWLCPLLVRC